MCQDIHSGIGVGPSGIQVVENQVEKEMENDMDTGFIM